MNILNTSTIIANLHLIYPGIAALILRVVLGLVLVNVGRLKFTKERERWNTAFRFLGGRLAPTVTLVIATLEILAGLAITVGYMTQIAAIVVAIIYFAMLFVESEEEGIVKRNFVFYWLMLGITLSLLFLDTSYWSI